MASFDEFFEAEEQRVKQTDALTTTSADDFGSFFDSQQATQQKAVLRGAVSTNAEQAREAGALAKRYPAPGDVLLRNLQDVKLQAAVEDADQRLRTSPKLAQALTSKPFLASQAHDDLDALASLEKFAADTWGSAKAGVYGADSGAAGLFRGGFELVAPLLDVLERFPEIGGNPLRRVAEGFGLIADADKKDAAAVRPKSSGAVAAGFQSGIESLVQNIIALPAAFANPSAGLAMMTGFSGGNAYQDARAKGLPMSQALPYATSQAAIEYATEKLPLLKLIGDVKAGTPFLKTLATQAALEIPGEQVATVLQDLNEWAVLNPTKPFSEYVKERPEAAVQTLVATLVGTGGNVAVAQTIEKAVQLATRTGQQQDQAQRFSDGMAQMLGAAEKSKLRATNPADFGELMQEVAGDGEIFLDAEVLNQLPLDMQQALPPAVIEQVPAALAAGGSVALRLSDVLTFAPGTPLQDMILQNGRSAPDAPSLAESQQADSQAQEWVKTEGERVIQEATAQQEAQADVDVVRQQVLDELNTAGRFRPAVNEQYATFVAAFYSTMAGRAGLTAQEMAAKYPLRVVSTVGTDAVLNQGSLDDVKAEWGAAGISSSLSESDDRITLSKIVVPDGARGEGVGTKAMQSLVAYADSVGKHVVLSPSPDFGGNKKRLSDFYKRFGFIENKGKNRAFSTMESMYRLAPGKVLEQGARGTFSPSRLEIALSSNADLTTFLHESGHFFLEVAADMATQPGAPADLQKDLATLMEWFGVDSLATWKGFTLDQQRPYHERFAESVEQYLMEGRAPSVELLPVFRRFRSWLAGVYRSVQNFLGGRGATDSKIQLSDEVRQVFDRMLASEDQIRQAEEVAGLVPDEEATQRAVEKLTARSLRDLKWTVGARTKAIKALQAEAKSTRKTVEAEVRAEVEALPAMQAKVALKGQKPTEADLEMIAAGFGFDSGDAMLQAIDALGSKTDLIKAMTDQRMLQEHGDLIDQAAIEQAANEAVHNQARARALATELRTQAEAMNQRQDTGRTTADGRRITVNAIVEAAKLFGANVVDGTLMRDLRSRAAQHTAAERRAGGRWTEATKAGKTAEAIKAKQDQVLNNAAARAALEAAGRARRDLDYLRKFDRQTVRKNLPVEYLEQIDQLLEGVDLRVSVTNKELARRKSLREWAQNQEDMGLPVNVPESLLDAAALKSWKEMTGGEFGDLVDAVKNIEHLGRLKNKLLTLKDKRAFDAIAEEVAATVIQHGGKPKKVDLEGRGRVVSLVSGFAASHRKMASLVRQMMGGKDGGALWDSLIRPMNEAGNHEAVMIEQAAVKLQDLYKPVLKLKGGLSGDKVFIPEINASLSRGGRLAIALNWGNAQNRQRVLGGDNWTQEQVGAILSRLTPVEAQFVNDVWDFIDSYWPEIKAKQERVSGVVEKKVEAEAFALNLADGTTVQMRGGYYPIKYDTERSTRAESQEKAEVAKDMMRGAFTRATTRRGHTKARTEEVNRPIRKDLDVITEHVTQVVHDLAWHEWIIDANRLLSDKRIEGAIRAHYGPDALRTMKDDVAGIATADVVAKTAIDKTLLFMRSQVSRATMGLSFTTALLQPFGLTQSMVRIGSAHVLRGAMQWAGDAARFESTLKKIGEKSDFMRLRSKTMNRELTEITQRVRGRSKVMVSIDSGLFLLTTKMQLVADIPTWLGAYEKATGEGLDDATAIARADQAVLDAQGGGQIKDLAEVQRKHPLLTQFYSYFSVTLNLIAERTGTTNFKHPKAVAGWLGDMALLISIPAVLPALLLLALQGGDVPDDEEGWAKWIAKKHLGYALGLAVGFREGSGMVEGFDPTGPPVLRPLIEFGRFANQAAQGEADEPAVMAFARFMGVMFGIPITQAMRSYRGWVAWEEGDAPPTSVLFGPPPKD
jgi:GNAT superfamily N-acetyltransferase